MAFDNGEPIYLVNDRHGHILSAHRTEEGATYALEFIAGAHCIDQMTLYR